MTRLLASAAALALTAGLAFAQQTTLTVGMQLEPPNLDPTGGAAGAIDGVVYANVFEGLTRIDRNGGVQPALAREWEISDDGLTYTFRLVEGATFHDGTALDAEDVKFSFERAMAEDSTNAQKGLFEPIERIEVVDPATVRITLGQPTGAFLFNMGWGDAVIVGAESVETNATDPVGTGPFRFEAWAKGDSVTLV
ncbi:MAG: ABC transporter substrate-binding protein, partial [Pseudomonadota bacterium]